MTEAVVIKANAASFFDEIINYKHTRDINRQVFWAANKVAVLGQQTEPVILMDNDTLCFKPIKHLLKEDTVTVYNFEKGKGYYPGNADKYVKQLSYKPRWQTESVNVGFLYMPFPEFTQEYSKLSLQIMEEFTKLKVPNSQYLIFAEQLVLRHLLQKNNVKFNSLQSTIWDCDRWDFGEEHDRGFFPWPDVELHARHYGPLKKWIMSSEGDYDYEEEIKMLLNCINFPKLYTAFLTNK